MYQEKPPPEDTISNDLDHHWAWDNNYNDSIGSFNFSAYNGPSFHTSPKKLGTHSIRFDQASKEGATNTTGPSLLATLTEFTLIMWYYPFSTSLPVGENSHIFGDLRASNNSRCHVSQGWDNSLGFRVTNSTGSGRFVSISAPAFASTNTWYMILAMQRDSRLKLSVDDGTKADASGVDSVNNDAAVRTSWGMFDPISNHWMNGHLDSCFMWSRALTDAEITYMYNSGVGRIP